VGYTNVRGLDSAKWDLLLNYVEPGWFDVLFVAETWYVGCDVYRAEKKVLASTAKPYEKTGVRHGGGIVVLASAEVRSRMATEPETTSSSILVTVGKVAVAGVYLPPSMPANDVAACLAQVAAADVVLGDTNVRYHPATGMATPPERGAVVGNWAQRQAAMRLDARTDGVPFTGISTRAKPTVDHCFVKRAWIDSPLHLLSNSDLGITTDHDYTLCLTMAAEPATPHDRLDLPRYRLGRLAHKTTREALAQEWLNVSSSPEVARQLSGGLDEAESCLVTLCQRVCSSTIGEVETARRPQRPRRQRPTEGVTYLELIRQVFALDAENGPLFSQDPALDALDEAVAVLSARWGGGPAAGAIPTTAPRTRADAIARWSEEEVLRMIDMQERDKACGLDGIHIQVVKALRETSLVSMLAGLFNACLIRGTTPQAWRISAIHLIQKDRDKVKTVFNARPISLIPVFRKLFESLLLNRLQAQPELELHPAQAGFRANYSTLTLAGTVHIALSQRLCQGAIFLDFKAAFDTVGFESVRGALVRRGCAVSTIQLLESLNVGLQSRVLANGAASGWIERKRGLLQGSPLSPLLWNLVVDDLLHDINRGVLGVPLAVFYADDGALLYRDPGEISQLLSHVERWSDRHGVEVNVRKCGEVSVRPDGQGVWWKGEGITRVDEYKYLGFPMTAQGIDFEAHFSRRLDQATARVAFLARHSEAWGVKVRLQVYRQYIAPVFEYGGALGYPWADKTPKAWVDINTKWSSLIQWVAHGKAGWRVSQNLLGLPALEHRFEALHMMFLWDLERTNRDNPLHRLIFTSMPIGGYRRHLGDSRLLRAWKAEREQATRASLSAFETTFLTRMVEAQAMRTHLSALVPWTSRVRAGTLYSDRTLEAPRRWQDMFFQYRRGVWSFSYLHVCRSTNKRFRRGDEECECQGRMVRLSRKDRRTKQDAYAAEASERLFTNIDFLLNEGRWTQAANAMQKIRARLSASLRQSGSLIGSDEAGEEEVLLDPVVMQPSLL
jgi:hypothetical protein